jgi:hypothetical protein
MRTGKYKLLLVAMLLLAYVGQSFAAAHMTCQTMASGSLLKEHKAKPDACPDHAGHPSKQPQESTKASDCCPHCDCLLGGSFASALPVSPAALSSLRSSVLTDGHVDSAVSQFAVSLFRPPISR